MAVERLTIFASPFASALKSGRSISLTISKDGYASCFRRRLNSVLFSARQKNSFFGTLKMSIAVALWCVGQKVASRTIAYCISGVYLSPQENLSFSHLLLISESQMLRSDMSSQTSRVERPFNSRTQHQ
jgi:hypothetical protein